METKKGVQTLAKPHVRFCRLLASVFTLYLGQAQAVINLADQPLSTASTVPGNLLLALSVEFPTAISSSYKASTTPYNSSNSFIGYFDSGKCYQYQYDVASPNNSYFEPKVLAPNHICSSSSTAPLWSGNWLNWASMQTIDSFRAALTGGYRVVDTATSTILEKAWGSDQGSEGQNAARKSIGNSYVAGATPFNFNSVSSRIFSIGNRIRIYGPSANDSSPLTIYSVQNSYLAPISPLFAKLTDKFDLIVRVQVCKPSPGLESNCTQYGSNYKPEGLMQQYAKKIRYGAFSYLNDSDINRDGGVLRAPMKFVGPLKPTPGQPDVANSATEWSPTTGIFLQNPDTAEATTSNVSNSGVLNYLNKFGQAAGTYKAYDDISEMYYAAIRYYKNQENVPAYTNLGNNTANADVYKDGFPVITTWNDPILYSCQKNFILGIGDTNTHRDANLPGSLIRGNEPAMPPEVAADTINVSTDTDMVGKIEGINGLGTANPSWCCNQNTFFMAGLAYMAHTTDIRKNSFRDAANLETPGDPLSKKIFIQTVSTFWLDVLETGYASKNQFYLATKYGGFRVPTGFVSDSSLNDFNTLAIGSTGTIPMATNMWHNNSDSYNGELRPDNYYDASAADKMVVGLQNAFANIASQLQESTTSFASSSPRVSSSGNISYQSKYDAASWTGDIIGNTSTFDAVGNPTFTAVWNAKTVLDAQSSRTIITCCTATGAGLPFQSSDLLSATLSPRTNYSSFLNVQGVPLANQSVSNYVAYLRGDRSKEVRQPGGVYRNRTFLLGDIVNSKLTPVGLPADHLTEGTNLGFSAYRADAVRASRKTVVYVGANDGMVHAFDGAVPPTGGGGTELFAYIPSFVYGDLSTGPTLGLASLGNPAFVHHNLVDQTPTAFDIDLAKTNGNLSATPNWKTVLIGGLGKGGKGYYALDVTDPNSWTSESTLATKVLWEFTDPDMGYSYGDPSVFKTKKYGWVVVLTSGYNNANGIGYFYIVNPANGALLEKISTGFGSTTSQAGLTYASGFAADISDGTVDSLYAGDLFGNVWRLDLTALSGPYPAPTRIAELRDPSGNPQPVTTRPLIEIQPSSHKRYVLIGTGRLLDNSDITNSQVQSFYSIADGSIDTFYTTATLPAGHAFPLHRSDMNQNNSLLTGIGSAPPNPLGWYFDLSLVSNGASERININPTVNYGVVAFAANLPNGDACNPSGTNRIFSVNFGTGQSVLTDTTGARLPFSTALTGVVTDIAFANLNGQVKLLAGNNLLQVTNIQGPGNATSGVKQINWRELPTAD